MNAGPTPRTCSVWVVVAAVLSAHCVMLAWSAARHSPTRNEVGHLIAGLSHWKFSTFDLYRVNPPLVRLIATAPVQFMEPRCDWSRYDDSAGARSEEAIADTFMRLNGAAGNRYFTVARWMCIPISVVGGLTCFQWSRRIYGIRSGMGALILWCTCPTILGHASLITTDAAAAALGVLAAFAFWHWLHRPSFGHAVTAGIALGLAELAKTTWTLLFVLWPVLWIAIRLSTRREIRDAPHGGIPAHASHSWCREAQHVALMLALAVLVLNIGYGFEGTFTRLGDYRFVSNTLGGAHADLAPANRFATTPLQSIPIPLPRNYVAGIDIQKSDFEMRLWAYLHGTWNEGGWWHYYLQALALKVPLGTWALLGLSIVNWRSAAVARRAPSGAIILIGHALAVLTLVSSQTGVNLGIRYVLPAFPFMFIWISKSLAHARTTRVPGTPKVAAVCLTATVVSSLWIYPHSLSYFNESVGGPRNGYRHLHDSNVDWGQDMLFLRDWQAHQQGAGESLCVAQIVPFVAPRVVGVRQNVTDCWLFHRQLRPDTSSVAMAGRHSRLVAISTCELRSFTRWLWQFEHEIPVARVGYSFFVFDVNRLSEDVTRKREAR